MFGGFYYPAMGSDDEICAEMDEHGMGSHGCSDTFECIASCPADSWPKFSESSAQVGECWQTCIVESCPNVTGTLFPELRCMEDRCPDACAVMGDACRACAQANCAAEVQACESLPCGD